MVAIRQTLAWAAAGLVSFASAPAAWAVGEPTPGAATATTVKLPDGPGSVAGLGDEAEVQIFFGQVSYGVPFDLPAGPAGFGPTLGLLYSGELGNSSVGVGWGLNLAVIRRSTRHGVPSFTDEDEFELVGLGGGGRLVPIGSGAYRLEGAGNTFRIEKVYNRFIVTDSDGTKHYFGHTEGSRLQDGSGRASAWFPELVVHLSGQQIAYTYLREHGQLYLETIRWGPSASFEVVLSYGERPDRVVSFRQGLRVETARRLATVTVKSQTEVLRAYHLSYDDRFSLSRLSSVRMTGYRGAGQLPELVLRYAEVRAAGVQELAGTQGWQLNTRGVALFDVDGDGAEDLLRLEMNNHQWRKNWGGRFGSAQPLTGASAIELGRAAFLDLDGDARADLVRLVDDTWRWYRLEGATWTPMGLFAGTRGVPLLGPGVAHADVNGDGRTDVLRAGTGNVIVWMAGGAGLEPAKFQPPIDAGDPRVEIGHPQTRVLDMNGDGLADVVWLNDAWMKVYLGQGDGTFVPWRRTFYPWPPFALDLSNLRLADLDRDGLIDLVLVTAGHVAWYPGRAGVLFSSVPRNVRRPPGSAYDDVVAVADANGNGSQDIVWSSPAGMWVLDLAGATTGGMLTQIDNGLGKTATFSYRASAHLSLEAESRGQAWEKKLPISIAVPVQVDLDPGAGGPLRTVFWGVRDGFWDGLERRFGGFLHGTQELPAAMAADRRVQTSVFHSGLGAERVLRGKAVEVMLANGLGQMHTVTQTTWRAHPISDLPDAPLLRVAVADDTVTTHYEGVTLPIQTKTAARFDGQGRPIEERDEGRLDLTGDETVTTRRYGDDVSRWVRGRVCEEKVLEAAGALVSHTKTFYGTTTGTPLGLCEPGLGLVRKVEGYLASEMRWVELSSVARYSGHWNPLEVTEAGIRRVLAYDGRDLYPVSETVTPEVGRNLLWQMTWDGVRGLPRTYTDPNSLVTHLSHDELGRLASIAQGSDPAHIHYRYNWTAPKPTTTTFVYDGNPGTITPFPGDFTPGQPWRQSVAVVNGAGEDLYAATRLSASRWIVAGTNERDERGRVVGVYDSFYWDGSDVRQAAPPAPTPKQTMAYDAYDRIIEQRLPTGAKKQITYQAFAQEVRADDLAPVTSLLDGQDRIRRTARVVGGIAESVDATYDAAGRLLSLSLQGGAVTHGFTYDTLGRLTFATDPDIGERRLGYDDGGRLTRHENGARQVIQYSYDGAGRLTQVLADDGSQFTYHYDVAQNPSAYRYTAGRLARVTEPTGTVQLGYDAYGHQVKTARTIDSVQAQEETLYSPSGLVLRIDYHDEFVVQVHYDAAGRAIRAGTLWELLEQDAAGRILREKYANGVTQNYERDALGQPHRIAIRRPQNGPHYYDVSLTRKAYGAIDTVRDHDGVGLDHSAFFAYDGAARLTEARLGPGAADRLADPNQYRFTYAYHGLQNMIRREAQGPTTLDAFWGLYRYGGPRGGMQPDHGPRQLTSVVPNNGDPNAPPIATFAYDLAGRQISQNGQTLVYNGLDQLIRVTGLPAPPGGTDRVEHRYGYDGLRVKTVSPDGTVQIWFTPSITEKNGLRHHYVHLGDRLIARVTQQRVPPAGTPDAASAAVTVHRGHELAAALRATLLAGGLLLLLVVLATRRRILLRPHQSARERPRPSSVSALCAVPLALLDLALAPLAYLIGRRRRPPGPRRKTLSLSRFSRARSFAAASAIAIAALVPSGCALFGFDQAPLWQNAGILYFHATVGAGPTLATRADATASIFHERRHESFGAPIDSFDGTHVGPIDYTRDPYNILNKQTDPATGFSYHGARWMAPHTARWTAPDPPVKGPDPKFLAEPWALHPYQYVQQNPILYWDPDGMELIKVKIVDHTNTLRGKTEFFVDKEMAPDLKELLQYAVNNQIKIHINSAFRTTERQAGPIQESGMTPAKPGSSPHEAGLALDFNLYSEKGKIIKGNEKITSQNYFIAKAKAIGFRWGGEFKERDPVHLDAGAYHQKVYKYANRGEAIEENQKHYKTDQKNITFETWVFQAPER